MTDILKIYCENLQQYIEVRGGETLLEVASRLWPDGNYRPICAYVNNRNEDLRFPVYAPKKVRFLTLEHPSAQRVYTRSLCMLLYKAVTDLYPGTRLRIEHSVAHGYYCRLFNGEKATPEVVEALQQRMHVLVADDIPFRRKERLTDDVADIFRRQGLNDKVRLLTTIHDLYTVYYKLGDTPDSYYGALAPSTGYLPTFALQPYHEGFLLLGPEPTDPLQPRTPVAQEKMFEAFTRYLAFNQVIGIRNVGELNQAIAVGKTSVLINVAEAMHEKYLSRIADDITARYRDGGARIVLIAGPSSSGKTTTTKRLAVQLMTNLLRPVMISLDDYFIDRHRTPRDANGEYDYEHLEALDLELFNTHLNALIAGEEVELPTYNFVTGMREYRGNRIRLGECAILLIEGIHGLNPDLTAHVPRAMKYLLYVSALTTLSIDDHNWVPTTDNRLLRRIIRDHKYRGSSALDTIRRWPAVRRGEERWIFPFQENADAMFNSSLLFEIAVIKRRAVEVLEEVPRNVPEYAEAARLLRFLSYFTAIDDADVPPTSLLREFTGGSSFHY